MKSLARISLAMSVAAALAAGQMTRSWSTFDLVPVPVSGTGGQAGGAGNPANQAHVTTNFIDAIVVSKVSVLVYLSHARVGDLAITLSHCGTTVTVFSGSLNQGAGVNGYYTFEDVAPTTFGAAVNATQGTVQPAHYKPSQSFSAFIGQSSTGPWTLTLTDLAAGISGTAGGMTVSITSGADFGGPCNLAIPDGSGGVCTLPITQVVSVPSSARVGIVYATLGLIHTYTSDLTIILSHAGVAATIMAADTPVSPANLSGSYTFDDDAGGGPWTQAVAGLPTSATVGAGYYRPLTPLAAFQGLDQAGLWYVTICDQHGADVGSLYEFVLSIAPSTWDLQITQPNGSASVTIANSGGRAGDSYANMMTLAPGAFPNGWLHGVDMSYEGIAGEVQFGAPFFGTLGPCGSATTTVPGPIPSGLTVYVTGLELDASGSTVNFEPAFAYTTP
jgi:subtilisin-like proprotein convertase family protein